MSIVERILALRMRRSDHLESFCVTCGSALPNVQMEGKLLVVPAGSLDSELDKVPNGHIFISNKANWDESLESVKYFERFSVEN